MFTNPGDKSSRKRIADARNSVLLDSIVGSFNNAATTFNLTASGKVVQPATSQNLLVVLGGIVQSPNSAYSIIGSTITFASAPPATEDCFMIMMGGKVSVNTTISLIANSGFVSNSSGIFVNANNGIVANSTGVFVNANTGITVNSSGAFAIPTSNSGIVSNTSGIFVKANTGIVANSSGVFSIPTGSNTQIQFNNSSSFGASNTLTYDGINLSVGNGTVNSVINSSSFAIVGNDNISANTTSIIVGNSTVNNTANSITYTFQSNLISPAIITRPSVSVVIAQRALVANSNTTPQMVFPAGQNTVTLAASTTYLIDAVYMIANAGITVNSQMQTSFGNNQNLTSINYRVIGSVANGGTSVLNSSSTALSLGMTVSSNAVTTVTPPCSGSVANASYTISIKGAIITGATGPAITPKVSWTVACNSTPQILPGTYITFTPVANSSYGNSGFGTWS